MHYFQKYGEEARFISLVFAQQIVQALAYTLCQVDWTETIFEHCTPMNPTSLLTNEHFFPLEIETRMLYNHSNIQGICL